MTQKTKTLIASLVAAVFAVVAAVQIYLATPDAPAPAPVPTTDAGQPDAGK